MTTQSNLIPDCYVKEKCAWSNDCAAALTYVLIHGWGAPELPRRCIMCAGVPPCVWTPDRVTPPNVHVRVCVHPPQWIIKNNLSVITPENHATESVSTGTSRQTKTNAISGRIADITLSLSVIF